MCVYDAQDIDYLWKIVLHFKRTRFPFLIKITRFVENMFHYESQ